MKLQAKHLLTLLMTTSSLLAATPVVMQVHLPATPTHLMPIKTSSVMIVNEASPLIFQPYLYNGGMDFSLAQNAMTEGHGVFEIIAAPNEPLNAQILPASSGFSLDGNNIPNTHYPTITYSGFAGSGAVDDQGNFTTDNTGRFTLFTGGTLFGYSDTLSGLYMSNPSLTLKITDRNTQQIMTASYNIHFSYLQNGHIESVRGLIFPPISLNPDTPARQNVVTSSPQSAELAYAPANASVSIVTDTVCLTRDGSTGPSQCDCTNSGIPVVQVTLGNSEFEKYCNNSTCKLFVGGTACYPANLAAGIYRGQGTIQMTYT